MENINNTPLVGTTPIEKKTDKKEKKAPRVTSIEDFLLERNYSDRLMEYELESNGTKYKIQYRPLTYAELGEMRIECRTNIGDIDTARLNCNILAKCLKVPDINNMALLEKAKCQTPVHFISTMFSPDEIEFIATLIRTGSGVNIKAQNQAIEEIKN